MVKFSKLTLSGFTPVLLATVISGLAGYIAVWLTAQNLIPADYTQFSVLWSTIFFSIGALSGIQQEITRSTSRAHFDKQLAVKKVNFYFFASVLSILLLTISGLIAVFGGYSVVAKQDPTINVAISSGLALFVFLSVLLGTLYGQQQWGTIAVLVAGEGIIRLILIALSLSIPGCITFLPWAICIPFGIVLIISTPLWLNKVKPGISLDVNFSRLARNSFSTVGAAAATAVIISGFPLLLRITSNTQELAKLAPIILIIMLVRAPLVVLAQSMQNLLIVKFTGIFSAAIKLFSRLTVLVLLLSLFAAVIGFFAGPMFFRAIFGNNYEPSGTLLAFVLLSSGLLAIQIMSGAFVLARDRHFGYILGWLFSAVVTVVVLLLPLELELRVMLALLAGPVAGIVMNATSLTISQRRKLHH